MNPNLKEYKRISNCIGISLIIFVAMFNVTNAVAIIISGFFDVLLVEEVSNSLSSIISDIAYIASFIVPALILRSMLKKKGSLQPMNLEYRLPRYTVLLIPAGIGITLMLSYINAWVLSVLGTADAYGELLGASAEPYRAYQIILMYVSTALVPAICEEILFRGAILSNLRPFGQGTALVISSVLFGLMHQNPYQLLYTTAAGLMLGYAYIKTNSIWCPTLMHFFNNAFAVTEDVIRANTSKAFSSIAVPVMDTCAAIVGLVCIAIFFSIDRKKQKDKYKEGSFGILLEESDNYEMKPLSGAEKIKSFFTPGMIIFVVVVLLSMLSTLGLLMLASAVV